MGSIMKWITKVHHQQQIKHIKTRQRKQSGRIPYLWEGK